MVVSIACDVVARTGNPLSRQSTADLTKRAREELNKPISCSTVWRILDEDAIKPWQYEHWIFPRAANFFEKAAVVLDLYEGYWLRRTDRPVRRHPQFRRENQHSGENSHPCESSAWTRTVPPRGIRV